MTEAVRSDAVLVFAGHDTFRTLAHRIWRVLGVLTLVAVVISSGSLPAGAMKIRPLHDRVQVAPQVIPATDAAGIVVLILFAANIQIDPHGVAHGVIRIDAGNGDPKLFRAVEALVGRDQNQEARELLILITPRIVRSSMETSRVRVERDADDADLLHWVLFDGAADQLIFSAPGVIQTLPPANGPPLRE